jgi:hypothetical protein
MLHLQAATREMQLRSPINPSIMEDGPIEISKWGEYQGQLQTKHLEPGKPPALLDETVEVEAGQKIVLSVNDASPYATMMFEVLVGESSNLQAFFVAEDGKSTINVRLRDFDANRDHPRAAPPSPKSCCLLRAGRRLESFRPCYHWSQAAMQATTTTDTCEACPETS